MASDLRLIVSGRTFWLLMAGFVICGFTTVGTIRVHLLPYAASCGFPPIQSATAFGVLAVFSMIGMIGYGWLGAFGGEHISASRCFIRLASQIGRGRLLAGMHA